MWFYEIMKNNSCGLVWLKKDLRIQDHRPLFESTQSCQRVIALYVYEEEWFRSYEFHPSHLQFLNESLLELQKKLLTFNIQLVVKFGDCLEVFHAIKKEFNFTRVYAHQETGVNWTYKRDLKIINFFKDQSILFKEYYQFSVIRRLKNRDHWNLLRQQIIQRKIIPRPSSIAHLETLSSENIRTEFIGVEKKINLKKIQRGGESEAHSVLHSFLYERGEFYLKHISSPFLSEQSGSRISVYLSFGNLTLTQVHHALDRARSFHPPQSSWSKSLWAFENRLWCHCHFIHQPSELEPLLQIEHQCVIGKDYPHPIVDPKASYSKAKQRIFEFRKSPEVKKLAEAVVKKHASRKNKSTKNHFPEQNRIQIFGSLIRSDEDGIE